jgi:hypothetical protein
MKGKKAAPKTQFTFLDAFLMKKVERHIEPERKGTPKGKPIGFSRKKHAAALMCLKKNPLKFIAETVKVSHGLLRKWRTEDSFKELVDSLAAECAKNIMVHIIIRGYKQKELADEYFTKPVEEILKTAPPELTWIEFNDLKHYSEKLIVLMMAMLAKMIADFLKKFEVLPETLTNEDLITVSIQHQCSSFLKVLIAYPFRKKDKVQIIQEVEEVKKELLGSSYKSILSFISSEWYESRTISEETLKKTIYTIHNLSGNFTPVDMDVNMHVDMDYDNFFLNKE